MAKDKLDEVIEALSPDEVGKKVRKKHQKAHLAYKLEDIEVPDYESFTQQTIRYTQHHFKETHNGADLPEEEAFSLVQDILNENREIGGFRGAYDAAREGRLSDVLKAIADGMEAKHVRAHTQYHLGKIDPFDWEEHEKIAEKLSGMYEPFLRGKETKNPKELAHQWDTLVQTHVGIADRVADVYGKYEKKKQKKAA